MLDDELIAKLQELESLGDAGMKEKREVLRLNGGFGRVLALAARGLTVRIKSNGNKPVPQGTMTHIPDDFPDATAKEKAIGYWEQKRRPDLVARVEEVALEFYNHHFTKNTKSKSWAASFQTWYVKEVSHSHPPRPGDQAGATVAFEQTNEAGWLQRIRLFYCDTTWAPTWGGRPPAQPYEPVPKGCHCPAGVLKAYVEERHQRQRG